MSGDPPESREGTAPTSPAPTVQRVPNATSDGSTQAAGHVHGHHTAIQFPFLEQLKHRNVIRVGILYLLACWLILDPVHVLFHMLDVPVWANRLVVILMSLGFPAVLLFAWVYEITPEGLKPTAEVDPQRSIRQQTGQRLNRAIFVVLVVSVAYLLTDKFWLSKQTDIVAVAQRERVASAVQASKSNERTPAPPAASIAVLPFSDLSAEGNQAYFSDGMAEEVLNVLAHVDGLKVASRTSSFQFRKSDLGAPAIATKLGVRHILEGSVRKAGNTVRITAQLIDATTDQHVWSQSFDRPISTANLFAIQDEIAKNIADKLAASMGRAANVAQPTARKADTADSDAYELYLKGRSLFIARSRQNLAAAAGILRAALAKDPKFARAWEMLGAVLVIGKSWNIDDENEYQAGVDAIDTALRLDPHLSMAHAVRAEVWGYRVPVQGVVAWEEAAKEESLAIENDKTNATAYLWRGMDSASLGYFDRAIQDYQRGLDLDPAYELGRYHLALVYRYLGRTDEALRLMEMVLESGYAVGDVDLAPILAARGDRVGALSILATVYSYDPQLIRPLFRALTDSAFSERDRLDAVALAKRARSSTNSLPSALLILKAYDAVVAETDDPPIWWARDDPAWLRSQGRKRAMQYWHLPEYWRKHGFPPQCKPLGDADFECR